MSVWRGDQMTPKLPETFFLDFLGHLFVHEKKNEGRILKKCIFWNALIDSTKKQDGV